MSGLLLVLGSVLAYWSYEWPEDGTGMRVLLTVAYAVCFVTVGYRIDSAYLRSKGDR